MALKKTETIDVRLAGPVDVACYIKVAHVTGNKDAITVNATFQKDTGAGELIKAGAYTFIPRMDGANFIAQAYEHLKTLPEFAGAEDC